MFYKKSTIVSFFIIWLICAELSFLHQKSACSSKQSQVGQD